MPFRRNHPAIGLAGGALTQRLAAGGNMGKSIKALKRKIGLGHRDVDNLKFILDTIWPKGTWNNPVEDGFTNDQMDGGVRRFLVQVYEYESKVKWERESTRSYMPDNAPLPKIPFDWSPTAEGILAWGRSEDQLSFPEDDVYYIIGRLNTLGRLKT